MGQILQLNTRLSEVSLNSYDYNVDAVNFTHQLRGIDVFISHSIPINFTITQ